MVDSGIVVNGKEIERSNHRRNLDKRIERNKRMIAWLQSKVDSGSATKEEALRLERQKERLLRQQEQLNMLSRL